MAQIMIYERKGGNIINSWNGHPEKLDVLVMDRQVDMLSKMYPDRFYDVGMIVSKGDHQLFFPDYIESVDGVKMIKQDKLEEVNSWQKSR